LDSQADRQLKTLEKLAPKRAALTSANKSAQADKTRTSNRRTAGQTDRQRDEETKRRKDGTCCGQCKECEMKIKAKQSITRNRNRERDRDRERDRGRMKQRHIKFN